ncbi:MAG: sensor histidine kinase [Protaetiibacter sp.]
MSAPADAARFDPRWSPARPRRRDRAAGVGVLAVAWALVLASVAVAIAIGPPYAVAGDLSIIYLGYAIVWGGVACIIVSRGRSVTGTILSVQGIGAGISLLLTVLLRAQPADTAFVGVLAHTADRFWLPGALTSFAILPLLLTTRPPGPRIRMLVGAAITISLVPVLLSPFRQRADVAANPLAPDDPVLQEVLRSIIVAAFTAEVVLGVVSLGVAMWRRWRGPLPDRAGQGWVVLGQALLVAFASPIFLPILPEVAGAVDAVAPLAPLVALLFMPATVVVFALGRRVGGIEVTVNRTVVNVLLVAVLVLAYSTIATTIALTLPVPPLIAGVIGVAALVLSLEPLRAWIQSRVDELVYGDAADPQQLVRALGDRVTDDVDGDDLRALAEELRSALRLARLELHSAEPGGVRAISGAGGGPVTRIALRGSTGEVGWIEAAAPGRQRVDRRVVHVLDQVSGVLAITVSLAEINRDILEAGDRAREVGAEERRMVARELDEGLGPGLARSVERLDRVPELVMSQSPEAGAELAAVREELAERTSEVRDLARTLLPGALDTGDVDTALRELAARFSSARLDIAVEGRLGDAIPDGREAAIHHLVAELVLLARRAPDARVARIAIEVAPREVRISLDVDGRGRPNDEGPILASVRDRADELGGDLDDAAVGVGRLLVVEVPR